MKLELKHLTPYLPYRLKIKYCLGKGSFWALTQFNIEQFSDIDKPVLRPLSDLTKEQFSYLYTLLRVHLGKNKRDKLIKEGYGITDLPYFIVEQLFQNHYDVFGLIPQGLAIDINTLK